MRVDMFDTMADVANAMVTLVWIVVWIALLIALLYIQCKLFVKLGFPWWHGLIPFLSSYDIASAVWGNGWLFLLEMIPYIGGVAALKQMIDVGRVFGKSVFFCICLALIPIANVICLGIVALDDSKYTGPIGLLK